MERDLAGIGMNDLLKARVEQEHGEQFSGTPHLKLSAMSTTEGI